MIVREDDPDIPWFDPGVYQVSACVYRVPLPLTAHDALKAVNAYVIQACGRTTVIDAGQALEGSRHLLDEALAALGTHAREVDEFLVTHYHRDHYTMALALRRDYGLKVSLGYGESASLAYHRSEGDFAGGLQPQLDLLAACGADHLLAAFARGEHRADGYGLGDALPASTWQDPDVWLTDGMPVTIGDRTLEAVSTPGHTYGHVAFHDLDNLQLFAGDHVLPHITPSIGFEGRPRPYPLRDYLASLRKVRERPDAALLPAHGPVAASVHARAEQLLTHHDQRLGRVQELLDAGFDTALAIAERMTWTRKERTLGELDAVNAMMAVLETKAHLDVLVLRGSATSRPDGPLVRYAGS